MAKWNVSIKNYVNIYNEYAGFKKCTTLKNYYHIQHAKRTIPLSI